MSSLQQYAPSSRPRVFENPPDPGGLWKTRGVGGVTFLKTHGLFASRAPPSTAERPLVPGSALAHTHTERALRERGRETETKTETETESLS